MFLAWKQKNIKTFHSLRAKISEKKKYKMQERMSSCLLDLKKSPVFSNTISRVKPLFISRAAQLLGWGTDITGEQCLGASYVSDTVMGVYVRKQDKVLPTSTTEWIRKYKVNVQNVRW